jgi:hypothetical protein
MTGEDNTLGGDVEIRGEFVNTENQPVDPTNLLLTVERPDGVEDQVDPTTFAHPAVGDWRALYTPAVAGTFRYFWHGSGARKAALDGEFYVREPLTERPEGWQPPSAGEVWRTSMVDFAAKGYTTATLQPVVSSAAAWVAWVTGRPMDASLPDELEPLARDAIRMRTEQLVGRASADAIETAGQEGIASASAGGASVTFRDPNARSAQGQGGVPTTWTALNETLWALMTPDRFEYWYGIQSGAFPPAMAVTPVWWSPWSTVPGIYHEDWGWGAGWTLP